MRFKLIFLLMVSLSFLNLSVNAAEKKILRAGTVIPIVFAETVSSSSAKPSQTISIKVAEDVKVGNTVFFGANNEGKIYIEDVVRARKFSKAGRVKFGGQKYGNRTVSGSLIAPYSLNISGQSIADGYLVDSKGNQHIIMFNNVYKGKRNTFLNVLSSSMIWNPIGWSTFWIKGKDVVIPEGYRDNVLLLNNIEL